MKIIAGENYSEVILGYYETGLNFIHVKNLYSSQTPSTLTENIYVYLTYFSINEYTFLCKRSN